MKDTILDLLLEVRDHRRQIVAGEVASARALVASAAAELAEADAAVEAARDTVERSAASRRPKAGERVGGDRLRQSREVGAEADAALAFAVERRQDAARRLERAEAHLGQVQIRLRRAEIDREKISTARDTSIAEYRRSVDRSAEVENEDELLGRWSRRP